MSQTSSGQQSTGSLNGKLIFEQDRNRIVGRDADNLVRLLILASGDDFAMKVAKPGFDALTASNSQLIFNSNQNVFKIVGSGTHTVIKPANTISQENSIAHGLSFIPMLFVNIEAATTSPGEWRLGVIHNHNTSTGVLNAVGTADVDSTNVKFKVTTPSSNSLYGTSLTYNYKYYLLQETSN